MCHVMVCHWEFEKSLKPFLVGFSEVLDLSPMFNTTNNSAKSDDKDFFEVVTDFPRIAGICNRCKMVKQIRYFRGHVRTSPKVTRESHHNTSSCQIMHICKSLNSNSLSCEFPALKGVDRRVESKTKDRLL